MDGIIGEVMYPSVNMAAFSYPERDVVQAVFQRHNDWICDYTSHAPQRLVGIGCLPLPEVRAGYPGAPTDCQDGFAWCLYPLYCSAGQAV